MHDLSAADRVRRERGFRTVGELLELCAGNAVLDPYSTLVSRRVRLGKGNVFYPGVVVECDEAGQCDIGSTNTFFPGTVILVRGGRLVVGSGGEFGPGGVQLKANVPSADIRIGDRVRLINGAELMGVSTIGDGAQILGAITAQNVSLAGGDDHSGSDPDRRGAVLKGFGLARGLALDVGDVVNGSGSFAAAPVERQAAYHR